MYPSRTITLAINRPLEVVYGFLLEPKNLTHWGASPTQVYRPMSEHIWETEDEAGVIHIRVTPRNKFGVLDFAIYRPGTEPVMTRARIYPNGKGCELCFTIFQANGMSDEKFASDFEWMKADLTVLKTYLES